MEQLISKKSEIHPDAKIGENVTVEAFAKIDKDVIIGDGTWIGANATIYPGARLGKNCKVFPGAVISAEPQDLKFEGEYSTVEVGDRTTIREYVTINRGTAAKGVTKVGSDTLLMAYAHLGHDVGCNRRDECRAPILSYRGTFHGLRNVRSLVGCSTFYESIRVACSLYGD
jgi:UDP-N-acetylglucosamine acyltransferase